MQIDYDSRFRLHENGAVTITPNRSPVYPERLTEYGKLKKTYSINGRIYRLLSSSAVNLFRHKVNKVIFVTLTFSEPIDERAANKCFSKYIDNLKNNYKLGNYVAVKEFTQNYRPHFHILLDIPFTNIKDLNRAWCYAYSDYCRYSRNSVRIGNNGKNAVVKNLEKCVNYLCKYITKSRYEKGNGKVGEREKQIFNARCYFISRSILSTPLEIDYEICKKLCLEYGQHCSEYEYCIVIYLQTFTKSMKNVNNVFTGHYELLDII